MNNPMETQISDYESMVKWVASDLSERFGPYVGFDVRKPYGQRLMESIARAAIEAMREPAEAFVSDVQDRAECFGTDQAPLDYLPRKKAAAYIGERVRGRPFAEITLIQWEKDKRGPPPTRIGRDVVYFVPSIEKWLRQQESGAASDEALK